MIRLLIVAGQLGLGGAEQQLFLMLREVPRAVFEPFVVSFGRDEAEHWRRPIESLGIQLYRWGEMTRSSRIAALISLVAKQRIDVVHAWDFFTGPYASVAGLSARVPALGSLRQSIPADFRSLAMRWIGRTGLEMLVANSRRAAASIKGTEMEGLRCEVVHNGVQWPEQLSKEERARRRARLGLLPNDVVLMAVGRLDENKNPILLLEAFGRIHGALPMSVLVFLGDGPLRGDIARRAEALGVSGSVHLPGFVSGAAVLMAGADVVALTSWSEGLPNVVMEASAAGVPVVATDAGGVREVVEDGVTGFVIEPGDVDALAERLAVLLRNEGLRDSMGRSGGTKMREHFSVGKMVGRFVEIYRELA